MQRRSFQLTAPSFARTACSEAPFEEGWEAPDSFTDQPIRALSVEDNARDERLIEIIIRRCAEQIDVVHADRLSEALQRLSVERFDVILLDLSLPDTCGLESLDQVHNAAPGVPIVVITGREDLGVQAVRAGAQDYLVKTRLDRRSFQHALHYAIERQRIADALRESEARLKAILNTAPDSIITVDERGLVRSFNPASEPLFTTAAEDAIGRSIEQFLPGLLPCASNTDDPPDCRNLDLEPGEKVGRRSDGSVFPADVAVTELPQGDSRMYTVITRDATPRKRAAEAHRLFLAATSHDVLNALNLIVSYAEMLAAQPQEQSHLAKKITTATRTLVEITRDLVSYNSGRGSLSLSPVVVNKVFDECVAGFKMVCAEKQLTFDTDLAVAGVMITDGAKLTRIVQNLLSNAARYTMEGGIHLSAELDAAELRITVRDSGIGIAPEEMPNLFKPHYRSDRAKKVERFGSGLGLASVQRMCTLLGGSITLESTLDVSSTFTVRLPRHIPAPGEAAASLNLASGKMHAPAAQQPFAPSDPLRPAGAASNN